MPELELKKQFWPIRYGSICFCPGTALLFMHIVHCKIKMGNGIPINCSFGIYHILDTNCKNILNFKKGELAGCMKCIYNTFSGPSIGPTGAHRKQQITSGFSQHFLGLWRETINKSNDKKLPEHEEFVCFVDNGCHKTWLGHHGNYSVNNYNRIT